MGSSPCLHLRPQLGAFNEVVVQADREGGHVNDHAQKCADGSITDFILCFNDGA